ncbi:transposable element Tcb1 transposase [Trichonephila clavipes]|nr:transposable element Tcb1 transposase [Trichonephila clavipes]
MSRRKQCSDFDQLSEFDRERTVTYRDYGLSFMEICSRVGGNQTILMRICDHWLHEAEWSACKTSIAWSTLDAERRTTDDSVAKVRIAGTLKSKRYISEVLEPAVLPYHQGLATAIFQQDNTRPHVAHIVQRFFVNHRMELLPWAARSPDLSPIENMWSMIAQRLTQITSPAATPDQLSHRVEAA